MAENLEDQIIGEPVEDDAKVPLRALAPPLELTQVLLVRERLEQQRLSLLNNGPLSAAGHTRGSHPSASLAGYVGRLVRTHWWLRTCEGVRGQGAAVRAWRRGEEPAPAVAVLDTYPYGGCLTALEALSHSVPIITMPAPYLRGRFTAAKTGCLLASMLPLEKRIRSKNKQH